MPRLEQWRSYLYGSRRDLQVRAARSLLERHGDLELPDLLFILDMFALDGLGAQTARALLERAGPELVEPMRRRLRSPIRFIRETACNILGRCGDTSATPNLVAALRDTEMIVRRAAGFALAILKDPAALHALREAAAAARDDDTNVRVAIDCAIREISRTI